MRFTCTRPDDLQIPSCADIVTLPPVCSLAFLTWPPFITRLFEYSWNQYCYFETTFIRYQNGDCNKGKGHVLNHVMNLWQSKVCQIAFGTFLSLSGMNIFLNSDHNYNRHAVGYLRWQLLLPLDFFGDGELLRAADKKFLGWIQVPAETVSHTSLINLSLELWLQWCERKVFLWNSDCSYGGVFFNILTSVMEEYQLADPGSRFKHSERFIQVRSKTSLSLQDVFLFLLPSSEQTLERKTKYATTPQSLGPQCRAPVILPSIGWAWPSSPVWCIFKSK